MRQLQLSARQWAGAALALLVVLIVGGTYIGYRHHLAHKPLQTDPRAPVTPPAPPHMVFGAGDSRYAFFQNERDLLGHYWVNDPVFGAIGDDSHDDTPAFTLAFTTAAAAGGQVYLSPPPVAYKITSELDPPSGVSLNCIATTQAQCTIRAHASMTAVLSQHSTTNVSFQVFPVGNTGITLDANNVALYGMVRIGDWLSSSTRIFAINAILDPFHSVGHRLPLVLGSVTPGGGAPGGVSISQPDLGYTGLSAVTNIVVKVATSTTYTASFDGGSTFSVTTQRIPASGSSNLFVTSSLSGLIKESGIQVAFPAGPFTVGWTWSFTATVQNEDASNNANNAETAFTDCWANVYGYSAIAGTVSTTTGSVLVTGSGTGWLSGFTGKQARPGDSITIAGIGTFPILGIADDTTIVLADSTPQSTVSGAAYHLGVGYGWYQDDSGDQARNHIVRGRASGGPNGLRLIGASSDGAAFVNGIRIDSPIVTGDGIGVLIAPISANTVIDAIEIKSGYGAPFYIEQGTSTTIREPRQQLTGASFFGNGLALIEFGGSVLRYAPAGSVAAGTSMLLPITSFDLVPTPVTVTGANQVITPPDVLSATPFNTSYTVLTPSADYVGANSVFLGAAHNLGQLWMIEVAYGSTHFVGMLDATINGGTGTFLAGGGLVLAPGESVLLKATGNLFSPQWVEAGPVHRVYTGPQQTGSGTGESSGTVITTSATPATIGVWDYTFGLTKGMRPICSVSAVDEGNNDRAFWDGVAFSLGQSGAALGTTTVANASGSNSGAPPAGLDLAYAISGGQLLLQVVGLGGRTYKWWEDCKMISAVKL